MRNTNNYFVTEYKFPPVDAVRIGQEKFKEYFTKNIDTFGEIKQFYFQKITYLKKMKNFDLVLTEIHIIGQAQIQKMFINQL